MSTSTGAITDIDGNFKVDVEPGALLAVSYMGYKTQEAKAYPGMRIVLQADDQLLDEVVVIACAWGGSKVEGWLHTSTPLCAIKICTFCTFCAEMCRFLVNKH